MKIEFSIETEYGTYTDALNLPDDVTYSNEEIDAMKQDRVNNWLAIITAPPIDIQEEQFIEETQVIEETPVIDIQEEQFIEETPVE